MFSGVPLKERSPGDEKKGMTRLVAPLAAGLLLLGCPDIPAGTGAGALDPGDHVPKQPDLPDEVVLELPPCQGGVLNAFTSASVEPPEMESGGWLSPQSDTRAAIESSWNAVLDKEVILALGMAAVVGYELCRGENDESDLLLWRPSASRTGRALFAWRFRDSRSAIIETPHAFVDEDGSAGAIHVFEVTSARALIASGTHPCANPDDVPCGTGSAMCAGLPAASDAILNGYSIFQLAHELFAENWPADWVISLQAMDDEGVALSDGTLGNARGGAADSIGIELLVSLPDLPVTSCNELIGASPGQRYCGAETVQAMHTNGAEDVCGQESLEASGRYVQITNSAVARERVETMADAIDRGMAFAGR